MTGRSRTWLTGSPSLPVVVGKTEPVEVVDGAKLLYTEKYYGNIARV